MKFGIYITHVSFYRQSNKTGLFTQPENLYCFFVSSSCTHIALCKRFCNCFFQTLDIYLKTSQNAAGKLFVEHKSKPQRRLLMLFKPVDIQFFPFLTLNA